MKRTYGWIFSFAFLLIACFSSFSCGIKAGEYTHPDFKTEYTIEEHIERIRARTEEKFAEEIQNGEIANIEVEILYAFYDNDPEYFMVQLQYASEFTGNYESIDEKGKATLQTYTTQFKHFIGFIKNDQYYVRLPVYSGYVNSEQSAIFVDGRNPYELSGYSNAKKYCGYLLRAVQTDEGILQIFNATNLTQGGVEFDNDEYRFAQRIIPESEHEYLMSCAPWGFFYNVLY